MSARMSPVTTFICGGWPPTPLGQEKPVPCMEHVHLMGSWMMWGRAGAEVTVSEEQRGQLTARLLSALAAWDNVGAVGGSAKESWLGREGALCPTGVSSRWARAWSVRGLLCPGDQEGP